MISCIAIDDEPLALEVLKKYIAKTPEVRLVKTFTDAIKAMAYLEMHPVDLLLLDIQMPDINGMELYNNLSEKPLAIFTTAHKEYAVEGFEMDAVDYLLKPFNLTRFQKAIHKVMVSKKPEVQEEQQHSSQYLYINADYKIVKVAFTDIIYIEALDNYVKINTANQSFLTLSSMKSILQKLPPGQFTRIHRTYIVANEKITFFQYRKIGLANGMELPVGDTYRGEISLKKKQL